MPHQYRVLVVDDDPELRRFLAGELAVGTGQQALIRLRDSA